MAAIIVSGALANKPFNGGNAWTRLSWLLGFRRLGYPVYFIEEIRRSNCVDESGSLSPFESSANRAYFLQVMEQYGCSQSSSLIFEDGEQVLGLSLAHLQAVARQEGVLFNISGHLTHPGLMEKFSCRIYYDDDPGYTQFWHHAGALGTRLEQHNFHFTIGQNIGASHCAVPTGQIIWRHTCPPVVLGEWPPCPPQPFNRFTTVASWRGAYGPVQYQDKTYGVKAHQFRKYLDLPRLSGQRFEIALQIDPADGKDRDALLNHRWQLVDPKCVAPSPGAFRHYVQTSAAEFSTAQGIYVDTVCGWFSDRSVRYLASGRPVLVQDTGFSHCFPTTAGLLAFRNLEEAQEGVGRIVRDYHNHCCSARRVAEEFFDSDKVISRLTAEMGMQSPKLCRSRINPRTQPGSRAGGGILGGLE